MKKEYYIIIMVMVIIMQKNKYLNYKYIMSNQVYSNDSTKYYDGPGLNNYQISGNYSPIPLAGSIDITFDVNNVINDSTLVNNALGVTTILREGMYSIMVVMATSDLTIPATSQIEFNFSILLDRPGEFALLPLQTIRDRYAPNGLATSKCVSSLSVTVYLKRGDVLRYRYTNLSNIASIIYASDTFLTINKIY